MTETENNQTAASKAPTHIAKMFRKGKNGKTYSTKLGVGWAHKTGGGINLQLEASPIDGKLSIMLVSDQSE